MIKCLAYPQFGAGNNNGNDRFDIAVYWAYNDRAGSNSGPNMSMITIHLDSDADQMNATIMAGIQAAVFALLAVTVELAEIRLIAPFRF